MFRCELTGQLSKLKEKPVKVTVQTRRKEYVNYYEDEEGNRTPFVTYGTEIVKEVQARAENVNEENVSKLKRNVRYV